MLHKKIRDNVNTSAFDIVSHLLPDIVENHVINHLPLDAIYKSMLVSHPWHKLFQQRLTPLAWKKLIHRDFNISIETLDQFKESVKAAINEDTPFSLLYRRLHAVFSIHKTADINLYDSAKFFCLFPENHFQLLACCLNHANYSANMLPYDEGIIWCNVALFLNCDKVYPVLFNRYKTGIPLLFGLAVRYGNLLAVSYILDRSNALIDEEAVKVIYNSLGDGIRSGNRDLVTFLVAHYHSSNLTPELPENTDDIINDYMAEHKYNLEYEKKQESDNFTMWKRLMQPGWVCKNLRTLLKLLIESGNFTLVKYFLEPANQFNIEFPFRAADLASYTFCFSTGGITKSAILIKNSLSDLREMQFNEAETDFFNAHTFSARHCFKAATHAMIHDDYNVFSLKARMKLIEFMELAVKETTYTPVEKDTITLALQQASEAEYQREELRLHERLKGVIALITNDPASTLSPPVGMSLT